jgi:hypothetical protein
MAGWLAAAVAAAIHGAAVEISGAALHSSDTTTASPWLVKHKSASAISSIERGCDASTAQLLYVWHSH